MVEPDPEVDTGLGNVIMDEQYEGYDAAKSLTYPYAPVHPTVSDAAGEPGAGARPAGGGRPRPGGDTRGPAGRKSYFFRLRYRLKVLFVFRSITPRCSPPSWIVPYGGIRVLQSIHVQAGH